MGHFSRSIKDKNFVSEAIPISTPHSPLSDNNLGLKATPEFDMNIIL